MIMELYTLFTYRDLGELREIQSERDVFNFTFAETKDLLDSCPEICIDISSLVYFLLSNKNYIQPVYANFLEMTKDTIVIIKESLAESALELLPFLFSKYDNYFTKEEINQEAQVEYKPYPRQPIYIYNNREVFEKIIKFTAENNIPIATYSQANGSFIKIFEQFDKSLKLAILDLTSVSYAIEDNKTLIYSLEQFLNTMPSIKVIVQTSQADTILKYFPLFFNSQEAVSKLIPDLSDIEDYEYEKTSLTKVTDLNKSSFESFIKYFNHNLIGHEYFKNRLRHLLDNFIVLNKVKEQRVLSIFLLGTSGIGKTEVARLIANGLQNDCYLAKINFQNYSSQDALNSLIGSPAGYVGCEHGELSSKIQKSKVGVLLCDEFEKATRPVFSFFLELLEEGKFTDSMAREYNMDGYIIIFTSNIPSESEYKKIIPQELQTRFDLVCEFEKPTLTEKYEYLDLLLEKAKQKFPERFASQEFTKKYMKKLYDFDYSEFSSFRDIKKVFDNRLIDFFKNNTDV